VRVIHDSHDAHLDFEYDSWHFVFCQLRSGSRQRHFSLHTHDEIFAMPERVNEPKYLGGFQSFASFTSGFCIYRVSFSCPSHSRNVFCIVMVPIFTALFLIFTSPFYCYCYCYCYCVTVVLMFDVQIVTAAQSDVYISEHFCI